MKPAAVAAAVPAAMVGGVAAATLDAVRAGPELRRFLSEGVWQLWTFLAALYGAGLAGLLGLLLLALWLLSRFTLFGRLWDANSAPQPKARLAPWALLVSALVAAALLGAALYPLALGALLRFHHRGLLAVLVGAEAVAIAFLSAAAFLLLLSILSPESRGISLRFRGPVSLYTAGWTLGAAGLGAAVTLLLSALQANPRLTPPLRALRLSLWVPLLGLLACALGHAIGRSLAGWVGRNEPPRKNALLRAVEAPVSIWAMPCLVLLGLSLAGAFLYWETLRLIDWRPFVTAAVGGLVALLVWWPLRKRASRRWMTALVLPLIAYGAALQLGRIEPVRKAALALASLSERMVTALAAAFDLDGDGVAGRWAIGGSDCDDLDFDRHPGAFDWPDNGIDENCNGHDATTGRPSKGELAGGPSPAPLPAAIVTRPNVVLITIDALRADHLSAYGYFRRTTPALDALAKEPDSVLFESAWAHAPSTRYSVPAILTGRYPSAIAWGPPHVHWPPEVLPENRLLAEMLAGHGYATTALLSYHYFERGWGLGQGFADYDTHLMTLHSLGGDPAATSGTSSAELADLALAKLAHLVPQASERPFFLWLHFYDPHYRYEPHAPPPGEAPIGDASRPSEIDLYDGEIRYTDQHIGRVLDFLRQSPAWPRTLVVVTADHGEGFGEHGLGPDRRHGYHLYANQTRVPLILRVPGLGAKSPGGPAPRRLRTPVGHVDLAPTVLHLASGRDPASEEPQLLGSSLLPLLLDPGRGRDAAVFQEVTYEGPTVRKALATERWHLIQNLIPDGTTELYDLETDPGETRDLYGQRPDVEKDLVGRLAAWLDDSAVPQNFAERVAGNLSAAPIAESPGALPIGGRIGDFLDVVSAWVRSPQVMRGEPTEVAVVYRVRRRIPPGYRLFVHLRGAGGRFLNLDHDFIDGLVPPQRLRPGLYVRDVMRLAVPAAFLPGPAHMVVGLFRRDARAEVQGPKDKALVDDRSIRVATLEVR